MIALGLPIVVGVLVGLLLGGRLRAWNHTKFDYCSLAAGALIFQLAIFDQPLEGVDAIIHFGPALYVASMLVIAFVLAHNARASIGSAHSVALAAAAAGVLLNCLVVSSNGGYMPRAALDGWPAVSEPSEVGRLVNVAPIGPDTRLVMLGDILPEPPWMPMRNVLSIGDVLLAGALGSWAFLVTVGGRDKRADRRFGV